MSANPMYHVGLPQLTKALEGLYDNYGPDAVLEFIDETIDAIKAVFEEEDMCPEGEELSEEELEGPIKKKCKLE